MVAVKEAAAAATMVKEVAATVKEAAAVAVATAAAVAAVAVAVAVAVAGGCDYCLL